ncbi:MAG: arginine repressor [Eubacteriales bacterium]|nr:arginine repressor [Eubacteriales bacterium]
MRYSRQNTILDLIKENEIETQEKLATALKQRGFDVTQATVSRDIKELQLIKILSSTGKYKYATGLSNENPISDRFTKIFKDTVKSVAFAGNIVIVKTLSGCAAAAAEAVDTTTFPHIVGSIAGDNTVFIVVDEFENSPKLVELFNEMLGKR